MAGTIPCLMASSASSRGVHAATARSEAGGGRQDNPGAEGQGLRTVMLAQQTSDQRRWGWYDGGREGWRTSHADNLC
jgi:hypothetical protein